jgi:hypothetical protein
MAGLTGWANVGSTLAGGNKINATMAEAQGGALEARTQDALAQARARIDENDARAKLDENLQGLIPDPQKRAAYVGLLRAKVNPQEVESGLQTGQNRDFKSKIADTGTPDDVTARLLEAVGGNGQVHRAVGPYQETNILHPERGVTATPLGEQLAGVDLGLKTAQTGQAQAGAALKRDQVANPDKYRILPPKPIAGGAYDGAAPHPTNETTAQLMAAGQLAPPAAGSKAYQMLGGDDFMKRVNFLAGQQGATPSATPDAAGGAPPPAGGPAASGGQPASKPFQANFNGATFNTNKLAQSDFARSTGTGGKLDSVNRIAGHLGVLEDLFKNLGNTNFVPSNQVKNYFQNLTGKQYPGSTQLASQMIGTEIVKSMTNIGAGGQEERLNLAHAFGPNGTPEGQKQAIATAQALVAEQAKDLAMRGATHGIKDVYTPGKYFSAEAIKRYGLTAPGATPASEPPATGGLPTADAIAAELARRGIK